MAKKWDAIIVGGRPAGASLAIRLGRAGLSVLLLEKMRFPSPPPLSCPAIFASSMVLLDELGLSEADYARGTPPVRRFVLQVRDRVETRFEFPWHGGRDYVYCVDRARFDHSLWSAAARLATVSARSGFHARRLLWEGDRVVGVAGLGESGTEEEHRADFVVGADGRSSMVARQAGARTVREWTWPRSSMFYAYWRNAAPLDAEGPSIQFCAPRTGLLLIMMDSADGRTGVAVHGDPRLMTGDCTIAAAYRRLLRSEARVWRRLEKAQIDQSCRGVRRFRNLHRQAAGPGWFLAGDAVHQRDALDSQGIYEALLTSKLLAGTLVETLAGRCSPRRASQWYGEAVRRHTEPMCRATLRRLLWEHRLPWPSWLVGTAFRWLFQDPEFQRRFLRLHLREIDPDRWLGGAVVLRALARGARDWLGARVPAMGGAREAE